MYRLVRIYEEAKYGLHKFLRLHKIVNDLGMGEEEIFNVLILDKNNEIKMLEVEKTNCTNHILYSITLIR